MSLSQRRNRDGDGHASGRDEDLLRDLDPNEAQNAEASAVASLMANRAEPGSPREMIRYLFLLTRGGPEQQALLDSLAQATVTPRRSQTNEWLRRWVPVFLRRMRPVKAHGSVCARPAPGPGTRSPLRRSMASDSSRSPIELDAARAALLEELRIVTGLDTHREVVDQALQVFHWVARERAYGARIISIDPDGTFRELNSAVLDMLAEKDEPTGVQLRPRQLSRRAECSLGRERRALVIRRFADAEVPRERE
jgi:hypothetical protein